MVHNKAEVIFESDAEEYASILETLKSRMPEPEEFGEYESFFIWLDDSLQNIDWEFMAEDFDYLRLIYDEEQNIKLSCVGRDRDYSTEVTFHNLTFPLTDSRLGSGSSYTKMCIIECNRFFGELDNTEETLSKFLM